MPKKRYPEKISRKDNAEYLFVSTFKLFFLDLTIVLVTISEFLLHPWMLVFIQPAGQVGFGVPPNLGSKPARPKGQLLEAMMEMRQGAEASGKVG